MNTLTTDQAILAGGFLGATLGTIITLGVLFYILIVIASWKIFKKAGEAGWKSLIPIYNAYMLFKIFWKSSWFWATLIIALVISIFQSIAKDLNGGALNETFNAITNLVLYSYALVVNVILYNRIAKSFGHGTGYTIGLVLFPEIFLIVLAFSKDKYKKIKD